jgi:hypothetical protein
VRVALGDVETIFRAQEDNRRMKDKAAHACHALCRARVVEEIRRRGSTTTAEHLTGQQKQLGIAPPLQPLGTACRIEQRSNGMNHSAADVGPKAQAELLRAMFDVGYFPPNTPPE